MTDARIETRYNAPGVLTRTLDVIRAKGSPVSFMRPLPVSDGAPAPAPLLDLIEDRYDAASDRWVRTVAPISEAARIDNGNETTSSLAVLTTLTPPTLLVEASALQFDPALNQRCAYRLKPYVVSDVARAVQDGTTVVWVVELRAVAE